MDRDRARSGGNDVDFGSFPDPTTVDFVVRLEEELARLVKDARVPGICVSFSLPNYEASAAAGVASIGSETPMRPTSQFQLGCITKVLTSLVALQLESNGLLDLDEPIAHYLPELVGGNASAAITSRHLLSHTSGLQGMNIVDPGVAYYYSWEKFERDWPTRPQLFEPGSVFSYDHSEYVLLGEIVQRLRGGGTIVRTFQDSILEPLGISTGRIGQVPGEHTVADHSVEPATRELRPIRTVPYCEFWAASLSDLTMSSLGLITLGKLLLGRQLTSLSNDNSVRRMRDCEVVLPPMIGSLQREILPLTFGLGLARYAPTVYGHNGSARGQTCGLRIAPERGIALSVAVNCWRPWVRDMLLERLMTFLGGATDSSATLPQGGCAVSPQDLIGTYRGPSDIQFQVSPRSGGVSCEIGSRLSRGRMQIPLRWDEASTRLVPETDLGHLSLAFFRNSHSKICAMVGMNAFAKVSS